MTFRSAAIGAAGLAAVVAATFYLTRPTAELPTTGPALNAPSAIRPSTDAREASRQRDVAPPGGRAGAAPRSAPGASIATTAATLPEPVASPIAPAQSPAPTPNPPVASPVVDQPATGVQAAVKAGAEPVAVRIEKDSVIGIRVDQAITTESARVDDKVTARVSRDVLVDRRTVIAAGTRLEGTITMVERGSPGRERARLGIRFHTLVLGDRVQSGSGRDGRVPIQTDVIYRLADLPGEPAAALSARALSHALAKGPRQNSGPARLLAEPQPPMPGRADARIPAGAPLTVKLTAVLVFAIDRN